MPCLITMARMHSYQPSTKRFKRKKNARRDTTVNCAAIPMPLQSELNAPAAALCSVLLLSTHLSLYPRDSSSSLTAFHRRCSRSNELLQPAFAERLHAGATASAVGARSLLQSAARRYWRTLLPATTSSRAAVETVRSSRRPRHPALACVATCWRLSKSCSCARVVIAPVPAVRWSLIKTPQPKPQQLTHTHKHAART